MWSMKVNYDVFFGKRNIGRGRGRGKFGGESGQPSLGQEFAMPLRDLRNDIRWCSVSV